MIRSVSIAACATLLLSLIASSGSLQAANPPAGAGNTAAATQAAAAGQSQVTDFRNLPLSGVRIKIQARPLAPLPSLLEETTVTETDNRGAFSHPASAPAGSFVILEKPGYGILAYNAGKLPPKIVLPPAGPLVGTIVDDKGTSLPNVVIGPVAPPATCDHSTDDAPHPTVSPLLFARTDAKGTFRVPNLPTHKYAFLARAADKQPALLVGRTATPATFMVYSGGTTVTGQVVGTRDRLPQPNVYVQATSADMRLYEVTDANGNFVFPNMPSREFLFKPYLGVETGQQSAQALAVGEPGQETSLTLLLNQGAVIAGKAIDEDTSEPMAGIPVGLGAGSFKTQMLTAADGSFHFDDVDALELYTLRFDTLRYVRMLPNGERRDYLDIPAAEGADRSNLQLLLRKRALLRGRVVDSTGSPVADARVRMMSIDGPQVKTGKAGDERVERPEFFTVSGATGSFQLGLYPGGKYEVSATTADDRGAEPQVVETYSTAPASAIELRLQPTVSIAGKVVDEHDVPVTHALVLALPPGSKTSNEASAYEKAKFPNAITDDKGEFLLRGFPNNQRLMLSATHEDFARPATETVTATAQTATSGSVRIRFGAGGDYGATVVDSTNIPIRGAQVIVAYSEGLEGQQITKETDAKGHIQLRALPVRQLERVIVRHDQFADYESADPVALPQQNATIRIKRKGSITVKIDGVPNPQAGSSPMVAVVLYTVPDGMTEVAANAPAPAAEAFGEQNRSYVTESKAVFGGLLPGWYKAALLSEGTYAESEAIHIAGDSAPAELTLKWPAAVTLRGRIADKTTGKGLAGASLALRPVAQANEVNGTSSRTVYSDAAGNFEVANAPLGAVHVKVVAYGYPEHEQTSDIAPTTKLEILLSNAAGALAGKISLAQKPVSGALLVLANPKTPESPIASAVSDAAGQYSMTGFPAGKYMLIVEAPAGEGESMTRRSVEVEVTDATTRKDVDLPALVRITGRIRMAGKTPTRPDGSPTTLLFSPRAGGGEGRTAQLNSDGTFTTEIEPGSYNVGLEDRPGKDIEIAPGGTQQISIDF